MAIMPISIKFTTDQRQWLQAEANRRSNGRIGTLIKSWVDTKRKGERSAAKARKAVA